MYIIPEKWTTTEFSSTVFSELLHTTENWSTPEFTSTTEFMSIEHIFFLKFMDTHIHCITQYYA